MLAKKSTSLQNRTPVPLLIEPVPKKFVTPRVIWYRG